MEALPVEIIEDILSFEKLSIADVLNFSLTSRYNNDMITNSTIIWKKKYHQIWPQFAELFADCFNDWYAEVRYIYDLKRRTREILSTMSSRFYKRYQLSDTDFTEWAELYGERPQTYHYLVDDLMGIVNTQVSIKSIGVVPITTPGNKTLQYYSMKVLRYLRQLHLTKEWAIFMALPPKQQTLEKGAIFVAQWCQPNVDVSWKDIATELDDLADQVKEYLKVVHPQHPLFGVPKEQLKMWRDENIEGNKYGDVHCRQIIQAMATVLYQQHGFSGDNSAYYYMSENIFINKVLEKKWGLPVTLAILYESVARRLGLKCEPIIFSAHFLLRFSENSNAEDDSYYIDVFNNGDVIRRGTCPYTLRGISSALLPAATTQQVVERMANILEEASCRQHTLPNRRITRLRFSLELLQLVKPFDVSAKDSLARLYMHHNMDTTVYIETLIQQRHQAPEQIDRIISVLQQYEAGRNRDDLFRKVEAAVRSPNLKYAVGMVMRHLTLNYKCVIYDWDPVCLASVEWQQQMNVARLTLKDEQPFYNVLVEDGSHRYVAQENLEPSADTVFLHLLEDIGRHFSHVFETHFVPNAEKEKEYPADTAVRHMYYQKMKFGDLKS